MAGWLARGSKKNCEKCKELTKIDSFPAGVNVRIVLDCENCEVLKSQPIPENEIIFDLYSALPANYDGLSGLKIISASDIKFLFELYNIPHELWEDYYNRLIFYHSQLLNFRIKIEEEKLEKEKNKK